MHNWRYNSKNIQNLIVWEEECFQNLVRQSLSAHLGQLFQENVDDVQLETWKLNTGTWRQCCGSGMFIPDPNFFHPGSGSKNLRILTQKIVSALSDIWSGLFIPDPDPDFFRHHGSRDQKGTGSRIQIRNITWRMCAPSWALYLRHVNTVKTRRLKFVIFLLRI